MGFNVIDSGMNSAMPDVSDIVIDSPDCHLHRAVGQLEMKDITLAGGAGAKVYDCFTVVGSVEIKALYAVFHSVADTTTCSLCSFQWHDGTNPHDLTDDVDARSAAVGSELAKTAVAGTALTFINASTGGINEVAANKQYQGTLLVAKAAATNKIQFLCTQDAATSAVLHVYRAWVCRDVGSSVTPV
jgi:hypothetical protein